MKKTQPPKQEPANQPEKQPEPESIPDENAQKIIELVSDLQRTRADFENFRKQVEVQKEHTKSAAKLATVLKFLPLLDDIERAIASYPELNPLEKSFTKTLSDLKLRKIDSEINTPFNPDFHDAISMEEGGGAREVIAETLRPGYLYESEVLRPAMVKVKNIA